MEDIWVKTQVQLVHLVIFQSAEKVNPRDVLLKPVDQNPKHQIQVN